MGYRAAFLLFFLFLNFDQVRAQRPETNQAQVCRIPRGDFTESQLSKLPVITDPKTQLQPGDVLILPFLQPKLGEADERQPAPKVYQKMLEGYQHAVMIYEHPKHGKLRLESPKPPIFQRQEIGGPVTYIALRPKVPKHYRGREAEYYKKLNDLALALDSSHYAYDALMNADILDPEKKKDLLARFERCKVPSEGLGQLDPQSCAELVVTALDLAGIKAPEGITAGQLLDEAIEFVKANLKEGETTEQGAIRAANEIIDMFTNSLGAEMKMMKQRLAGLPEEIAVREKALKDIPVSEKKYREPLIREIADLKQKLVQLPQLLKEMEGERQNFESARDLLKRGIVARLRGSEGNGDRSQVGWVSGIVGALGDAVTRAAMDRVLSQKILRPSDLIKAAEAGQFEIVGYYPGDAASTCKLEGQGRARGASGEAVPNAPAHE